MRGMKLIVCNAGSTSLKFKLYEAPGFNALASARIERIGDGGGSVARYESAKGEISEKRAVKGYREGILWFNALVCSKELGVIGGLNEIGAVGFKTVAAKGKNSVCLIDEACKEGMREYLCMAPAHNRAYLDAIAEFEAVMPDTPKVGVFEPFFHSTIPEYARVYGIPYEWTRDYGVERLGFHGASHRWAAQSSQRYAGSEARVISCHLGGSSSVCAIKNGRSVNTSFGFSLQSGLIQAYRSGDMDPFALAYLRQSGLSEAQIYDGLVKRGGLLGISGVSGDMRDIEAAAGEGNDRAALALKAYAHGVKMCIGAYYAQLGGLDMLIFTGGIGENSPGVRALICDGLGHMGIALDEDKNAACRATGVISSGGVTVAVLSADEERVVAQETYDFIRRQ